MKAIISGCAGQQGRYLSALLLEKRYEVHGMLREIESSLGIPPRVIPHYCEMTDKKAIFDVIEKVRPDEIYNLAAMNDVALSFEIPNMTINVNCGGFIRTVESVRTLNLDCKIYFAASSEMFGSPYDSPQTENTPFSPKSPYGVSKVAAVQLARIYREKYGTKIYCGILYNNESPIRPEVFLSRKVCKYVASVAHGNIEKLKLGNLDARRDWGYSKEYCYWTWLVMQHPIPGDFIMATGVTHSVREFIKTAFAYVGILDWEKYIEIDKSLYRPAERKLLVGDISKSKALLDFEPKTTFKELISIMMDAELQQYEK